MMNFKSLIFKPLSSNLKLGALYCILALQFSCSAFKVQSLISNQEFSIEENKSFSFVIRDHRIFTNVEVNGVNRNFILDTGAPSLLSNNSIEVEDSVKFGEVNLPSGSTMQNYFVTVDSLKIGEHYRVKNCVLRKLDFSDKSRCQQSQYDGILGVESINLSKLFLNFSANEFSFLSDSAFLAEGFSEFENYRYDQNAYMFYCRFPFDFDKEYLFDTGFNGEMSGQCIGNKSSKPIVKTVVGSAFSDVSGEILDSVKYSEVFIANSRDSLKFVLAERKTAKRNNLGLKFIELFDWILDYDKGKLYYRRNMKNKASSNERLVSFKASNGCIYLKAKDILFSKAEVGDRLISYQGDAIDESNLCEILEVVNDINKLNLNDCVFETRNKY